MLVGLGVETHLRRVLVDLLVRFCMFVICWREFYVSLAGNGDTGLENRCRDSNMVQKLLRLLFQISRPGPHL
jgi:hypothetical protein